MFTVTVSAKGAVVIPAPLRRKLGIEPGVSVSIVDTNGSIRIVPLPKDPIKALRGSLKSDRSALEIKKSMKDKELQMGEKKHSKFLQNE